MDSVQSTISAALGWLSTLFGSPKASDAAPATSDLPPGVRPPQPANAQEAAEADTEEQNAVCSQLQRYREDQSRREPNKSTDSDKQKSNTEHEQNPAALNGFCAERWGNPAEPPTIR